MENSFTSFSATLARSGRIVSLIALVGCTSSEIENAPFKAIFESSSSTGGGGGGDKAAALTLAMDEAEIAGFSGAVIVAQHGTILLQQGYGQCIREVNTPCSPEVVFDIGSLTKQFTAATVMKLVASKELSLDDTLGGHYTNVPPDKAGITVHQLLTHTAGFPDSLGDDYTPISSAEYLALALSKPLEFKPGARHSYSNVGYSILGILIEKVRSASYEQVLNEEVLAPAKLSSTGYLLPDWKLSIVAHGYERSDVFGSPLDYAWAADGPYWNLRANGGILSTPLSIYAWHEVLLGDSVLDASAKALMFTPYVEEWPGSNTYYGYGWVIEDGPFGRLVWHDGTNGYFYTELRRYLDQEITVFVASNALGEYFDGTMGLAQKLSEILLKDG